MTFILTKTSQTKDQLIFQSFKYNYFINAEGIRDIDKSVAISFQYTLLKSKGKKE